MLEATVRRRAAILTIAVAVCMLTGPATGAPDGVVVPVPSTPTTAPSFVGTPAEARPILGIPRTPRNPHLAANGDSSIHNDGWQTDTYRRRGPLGVEPETFSASINGVCGSIAYDSRGRIVTTCVGVTRALYLVDPETLYVIDSYELPGPPPGSQAQSNPFKNFGGGAYFYVDDRDRAVIGTYDGHFLVIAVRGGSLRLVRDLDLSHKLREGEVLNSGLPGTDGLLWFVTKKNGAVGTLDLRTGKSRIIRLGTGAVGQIQNSIAVGSHGEAYVATNRKLYRFRHNRRGKPEVVWSVRYDNSGLVKPGQVDDGTGTTPTVLPGGYVAITDNADPMQVVVYRTAKRPRRPRTVCEVPVFRKGAGSTENSLIGAGRSLVVENNYGYDGPQSVLGGGSTVPGFTRVDINKRGTGCRTVWRNTTVSAPTVVPKLSLGTGLIYAYTKPAGDATDPWYFTAIDFRTGKVVWKVLAGAGPALNNNYAGLSLSRDGTAYLGVIPGIVALRDGG
jgi:hypothetical protein